MSSNFLFIRHKCKRGLQKDIENKAINFEKENKLKVVSYKLFTCSFFVHCRRLLMCTVIPIVFSMIHHGKISTLQFSCFFLIHKYCYPLLTSFILIYFFSFIVLISVTIFIFFEILLFVVVVIFQLLSCRLRRLKFRIMLSIFFFSSTFFSVLWFPNSLLPTFRSLNIVRFFFFTTFHCQKILL